MYVINYPLDVALKIIFFYHNKVYSSTPLGAAAAARYNAPVETNLTATFARDELVLTNYDRSRPAIYYWSLPLRLVSAHCKIG